MKRPILKSLMIHGDAVASPSFVADVAAYIRDVVAAAGGDNLEPGEVTSVVSNWDMKAQLRCFSDQAVGIAESIMDTAADPHSVSECPDRVEVAVALAKLPPSMAHVEPSMWVSSRSRRKVRLNHSFREIMMAAAASAREDYETILSSVAFDSPVLRMGRASETQRAESCRLVYRGRSVEVTVSPATRPTLLQALESSAWCRIRCDAPARVIQGRQVIESSKMKVVRASIMGDPPTGDAMIAALESLSTETIGRLATLVEDMN